ncbi:hypothetical protein Glove_139g340 [Diversispora epigaea]|uniref:Uncharacterized protein n=1 Tax=Diversispora epigaea TaxID=1348612 RepID=A0A397J1Y5_9GLOM|nr:hypothetical protein Glove_139g340 [Diversispora epigaea]
MTPTGIAAQNIDGKPIHSTLKISVPAQSELEFKGNFFMYRARLQHEFPLLSTSSFTIANIIFENYKNLINSLLVQQQEGIAAQNIDGKPIHSTLKISGEIYNHFLIWRNFSSLNWCPYQFPPVNIDKISSVENFFPLFLTTCHCQQTDPTFYQEKLRIGILDPQTKLVIA